jgi:hypothetical protein
MAMRSLEATAAYTCSDRLGWPCSSGLRRFRGCLSSEAAVFSGMPSWQPVGALDNIHHACARFSQAACALPALEHGDVWLLKPSCMHLVCERVTAHLCERGQLVPGAPVRHGWVCHLLGYGNSIKDQFLVMRNPVAYCMDLCWDSVGNMLQGHKAIRSFSFHPFWLLQFLAIPQLAHIGGSGALIACHCYSCRCCWGVTSMCRSRQGLAVDCALCPPIKVDC